MRGAVGATIVILCCLTFTAASARPAIDVLRDATRCFAAYDAAYQAAKLTANQAAQSEFAPQRASWLHLVKAIGAFAAAGKDTTEAERLAELQTAVYRKQFTRIVESIKDGDDSVLVDMHLRCQALGGEIRAAASGAARPPER